MLLCLTVDNLSAMLVVEHDEVCSYSKTIAKQTGSKARSLNWVFCNTMAATLFYLLRRVPRSNIACTWAGSSFLLVLRHSGSVKNLLILGTGFPPVNQKLTADLKSAKLTMHPVYQKLFQVWSRFQKHLFSHGCKGSEPDAIKCSLQLACPYYPKHQLALDAL